MHRDGNEVIVWWESNFNNMYYELLISNNYQKCVFLDI